MCGKSLEKELEEAPDSPTVTETSNDLGDDERSLAPNWSAETVLQDDNEHEFVMEKIVSHLVNNDAEHPTSRVGEIVYLICWFGYGPEGDTYLVVRPHQESTA